MERDLELGWHDMLQRRRRDVRRVRLGVVALSLSFVVVSALSLLLPISASRWCDNDEHFRIEI